MGLDIVRSQESCNRRNVLVNLFSFNIMNIKLQYVRKISEDCGILNTMSFNFQKEAFIFNLSSILIVSV